MDKKRPDPEVGFRLLEPGDKLTGSQLWLYGQWDTSPQSTQLPYTEKMMESGLFYRIQIEDVDKVFEKWISGLLFVEPDPQELARASWKAARNHYLSK